MGVHNVVAALGAAKVSDRAVRVLAAMAVHALDDARDDHPARRYHGGRDLVCLTLGWPVDNGSRRRVDRALRELQAAGLVARDGTHGRGKVQAWTLLLPGLTPPQPVDKGVDDP